MNDSFLARGRLLLLFGGLLFFLGALTLAVARWNQAAIDRAFVDAAAVAAPANPRPASPTNLWMPAAGAAAGRTTSETPDMYRSQQDPAGTTRSR